MSGGAPTVARTAASQVALLVQLKVFQTIGRFRRAADVPPAIIEHVARRLGMESGSTLIFPDRTLYRHRPAIRKRLGVVSWGAKARELVQATMRKTAQARTDPADIINSAIDALIRHGFELPALDTLRRLAGTAHSKVNAVHPSSTSSAVLTGSHPIKSSTWRRFFEILVVARLVVLLPIYSL